MNKVLAALLLLPLCGAAVSAHHGEDVVRWKGIAGVITAQGVDNPVGDIDSGTFAWTARSGRASVNLVSGQTAFEVEGLVINGTVFSGTPGPVNSITGTLVCNPGQRDETVLDTPVVSLNAQGDARFFGQIGNIPVSCGNPLFLLRIATPATGAVGRWIATGTERSADND
ncbi:MAG TPA: hypothetical protein VFI38_11465 [Candidatus Acidoferrum sp.]|nr:hypothetical protein [Candidatus Acidoferrum sp.]